MRYAEDKASRPEGMGTEHMLLQNCLPLKFWESYSAFANSGGGSIVAKFSGTFDSDIDEAIDSIWSGLSDRSRVSSNILMDSDVRRTPDGFVVSVPSADKRLRPIYINDSYETGTFVRYDGMTVRSSIENTRSMMRDSSDVRDVQTLPSADISTINMESAKAFRSLIGDGHIWKELTDDMFLSMTSMAVDIEGCFKPTNAGILLFSNYYTASSMFLGYRLRYLDEETKFDSEDGKWSGNIFDFYSLVSERIDVIFNSISNPLKEIVINALAHSDYYFGEGISVVCCNNSLTIVNNGLFRSDQEASVNGKRDRRNPSMAKILGMISPTTGLGVAISSINKAGYEVSIKEDYISGSVTITIKPYIVSKANIGSIEERILNEISNNDSITVGELSECIGLSRRQVERYISELKSRGALIREGSRRAGHWKLL